MAPSLHTAPPQIAIANLLSLCIGTVFSVNVFTEPVEHASPILHNVWAPAVSAIFFLSSTAMAAPALLLSRSSRSSRGSIMRFLCALSALGFMLFAFAAPAVLAGSRVGVTLAVAELAVPLGILSVIIMEHLVLWLPGSFGAAVALSSFTFSLGMIFGASAIHALLHRLSVPGAIVTAAFGIAVPTAFSAILLRLPPSAAGDLTESVDDTLLEEPHMDSLTLRDLAKSRDFWLFFFFVVSFGAPFPVLPFFFKIGAVYDAPQLQVLRFFQGGTVATMVFNITTARLTDIARRKQGALASGARNVLFIMFLAQTCMFALLWWFVPANGVSFVTWAIMAIVLRLVYQSGFGMAALLAADMFGKRNLALVLGIGAGLALGCGEGLGTILIMSVNSMSVSGHTPKQYEPYYGVGLVWSILALLALCSMRRAELCIPSYL